MLEELRKKPRGVRNLYAFWGAAILTSIIGFVWVLSLSTKFDKIDTSSFKNTSETTGAFSQFIEETKRRFSNNTSTTIESPETESKTSTTSPQNTSLSTSSPRTQFLIATTTSEKPQTGTSTPVAN